MAVEADADSGSVRCVLRLADGRDLDTAVARVRRLLDLDADPAAVDDRLGRDPVLGPLVAARPGLRAPGSADPAEVAVRAVLGQQVSVAGARTAAARLVAAYGEPLPAPVDGLTHLFPTPGPPERRRPLPAPDAGGPGPGSRRPGPGPGRG